MCFLDVNLLFLSYFSYTSIYHISIKKLLDLEIFGYIKKSKITSIVVVYFLPNKITVD